MAKTLVQFRTEDTSRIKAISICDKLGIDIELPDLKDRVFYEVVMEQRKSSDAYLVTGNIKHFPVEPYVVTPKEMMDIILSDTV